MGALVFSKVKHVNCNDNNGYSEREINGLETMVYAVVYGAGIDVKAADDRLFFFDVRLSSPLSSIGQINGTNATNQYFTLSIGYLY